jgi:hypothetical protein
MSNVSFLGNTSSPFFWVAWSLALIWQNYAFTRVSRARNSGSLKAHALAALQSNGVWFIQSLFVYSAFMSILTGKAGWVKAVGAALYYTAFTMAGSLYAHFRSLKKEKGATAVGANKLYAQIPVAEYERLRAVADHYEAHVKDDFASVKNMAENAYSIVVGSIPDSRIAATKIAGQLVTTGVPEGSGAVKTTA